MSTPGTFTAYDPTTGEPLQPPFKSASAADVARAAEAADAAFYVYGRSPASVRARLLRTIAQGIEQLGETLTERATRETGLPHARIVNECARTCSQLRLFADLAESDAWIDERIDVADPARQPQPKPRLRSRLRPLGPVAVFGASNFPLAFSVAGGDTAAALAVGCPVIVKAHPAHPGTSLLVGEVITKAVRECGLPAGVFALLFDAGHEIGVSLMQHPAIQAGAFTGSRSGGLALWRVAQERPQPVPFFAEMSSVNPVFLFPGKLHAAPESIAVGLHASMTLGVGQFCTQPGLIFLCDNDVARLVLDRLAVKVQNTVAGTMLTAGICDAYARGIQTRAEVKGVRVRACGHAPASPTQAQATLHTADVATYLNHPVLAEEIFGPTSLVIQCKSPDEYVPCAQRLEGQLTATVWGEREELQQQRELLWVLEQKAGRLVCNGFPTGVEVGTAMVHGGPFPATTDSRFTSVGTRALLRFVRPVAYQDEIDEFLS
jgi:2,5-dioxopentanoate dehydrogenase